MAYILIVYITYFYHDQKITGLDSDLLHSIFSSLPLPSRSDSLPAQSPLEPTHTKRHIEQLSTFCQDLMTHLLRESSASIAMEYLDPLITVQETVVEIPK